MEVGGMGVQWGGEKMRRNRNKKTKNEQETKKTLKYEGL